jgi:hypothetical protein
MICWAVSSFWMALIAGFWHMILWGDFYKKYVPEGAPEEPSIGIILIGFILLGFFMTYLYSKLGKKGIREGIYFGAIIGFIWVTPHAITEAAINGIDLRVLFLDGGWHIVEQAIGGFWIAFLNNKLT